MKDIKLTKRAPILCISYIKEKFVVCCAWIQFELCSACLLLQYVISLWWLFLFAYVFRSGFVTHIILSSEPMTNVSTRELQQSLQPVAYHAPVGTMRTAIKKLKHPSENRGQDKIINLGLYTVSFCTYVAWTEWLSYVVYAVKKVKLSLCLTN